MQASEVGRYLSRIGFDGVAGGDVKTLHRLLEAHLYTIPFENIDIQLGVPIHLDIEAFYNKIVLNKRGGYCYEINGLFHQLLCALGFNAVLMSGRVGKGRNHGAEFDHLVVAVSIGDQVWLVDAGYGDFSMHPILLDPDIIQEDGRAKYRVKAGAMIDGKAYYSIERQNPNKKSREQFETAYYFDLQPRELWEFAKRNRYQQEDPGSHFTQNLICSLPTRTGRVSIINNSLLITDGQKRKKSALDPEKVYSAIEAHFGISQQALSAGRAFRYHHLSDVIRRSEP
jgi:N-hydroxyarylamine O-acetyltransferase